MTRIAHDRPARTPGGLYRGGGTFATVISAHEDRGGSATFTRADLDLYSAADGILDVFLYAGAEEAVGTFALTKVDAARVAEAILFARLAPSVNGARVPVTEATEHSIQTANRNRHGIVTFAGADATVTFTTDGTIELHLFEGPDQTEPAPAVIALTRDEAAHLERTLRGHAATT